MASVYRRDGKWRAEVRRAGLYRSETFPTRAAAQAWAARIEADYEAGRAGRGTSHTVRHTLERFRDEICPQRAGGAQEAVRIDAILRAWGEVDRPLSSLTAQDWIGLRTAWLKRASGATVRRYMALLRSIVQHAQREWHYIAHNTLAEVARPPDSPHRTRVVSAAERAALAAAAGWMPGERPAQARHRAVVAFEIACETGMRAGELASLTAAAVDLDRGVAHLARTKNGDARDVPLSSAARALLALLLPADGPLIGMSGQSLDTHFRRVRDIAAVDHPALASLHFHDSRRTACTLLAQRLSLLDLARVIGHRDPRSLMIYYAPDAADIAARLG